MDLAAETFAAVVASLDRFDRARGLAATWLFTLARHKLHQSFSLGDGVALWGKVCWSGDKPSCYGQADGC
jgi:hypothetical protein